MVKIRIYDAETVEQLAETRVKKMPDFGELNGILRQLQEKENFLKGENFTLLDGGIHRWTTRGGVVNSLEMAGDQVKVKKEDGSEEMLPLYLGVIMYPEGYVLNTGKNGTNIFGSTHAMYLKTIGKRNVRCSEIGSCHVFPSLKNLEVYIRKHSEALQYLVSHYGYQFSVEYANEMFEEDAADQGKEDSFKEVESLLSAINEAEEAKDDTPIPENPTEEDMKEEAVQRMEKLWIIEDVISRFKRDGLLMQSEAGILYDLDEEAKKAIRNVKEAMHCILYHVVVSHFRIGTMYTVLYVSDDPESWSVERVARDGAVRAYVYNATYPICSEFGDVFVQETQGRLIRTA